MGIVPITLPFSTFFFLLFILLSDISLNKWQKDDDCFNFWDRFKDLFGQIIHFLFTNFDLIMDKFRSRLIDFFEHELTVFPHTLSTQGLCLLFCPWFDVVDIGVVYFFPKYELTINLTACIYCMSYFSCITVLHLCYFYIAL